MTTQKIILTPPDNGQEKGYVLVGALLIMLLLVLIGISASRSASLELQIAAADRAYQEAFYQADAGVQYVLARIKEDLQDSDAPESDIAAIDPTTDPDYNAPGGFLFAATSAEFSSTPYQFTVTGQGPKNAEAEITVTFDIETPPLPAFGVGIITDGSLNINGAPDINGGMHANGNISQNGAGVIDGQVSAVGTASVGSSTPEDSPPQSGADEIDVPPITDDDFDALRAESQNSPNEYIDEDYDLSEDGDLGGRIIFVEGDVTVSGDIHNGTLVATGNITVNGSSEMTAGESRFAMIAGGDIVMNGANDSHGLFWSNGSFVQNGSSTVVGSIVSGGPITRNGTFNFTFSEVTDPGFLPTVPPNPVLISWED